MDKKKILKLIRYVRSQVIIGFSIAFYLLSIYYFFYDVKLIWALVFSIFLFLFIHYFLLEIKKTEISTILIVIVILTGINLFFLGFNNFFYVLGIFIFHIAIFYLIWDIYEEVYNRIEISSYKVFTMGVRLYSLILSLVFAVSFVGTYREFNLTCDEIYKGLRNLSSYSMQYLGLSIPANKDLKVKDLVSPHLTSGDNLNLTGEKLQTYNNIKISTLTKIDFWKNVIINQIMENKKILDKNICQIIVSNIKEKYTKPGFKFTVMFLIFLLFYPFIRLFLYILAILNLLAFKLINWSGIYKFVRVVEEVEVIE